MSDTTQNLRSNGLFNRREALGLMGTGVAGVLAGCSSDPTPPQKKGANNPIPPNNQALIRRLQQEANRDNPRNLYNVLNRFRFTGQNGEPEPVNVNALADDLRNKFTTLTFGFEACEQYCPRTGAQLAALLCINPQLTHIVVSVDPQDNANQASRDAFMAKLASRGLDRTNIKILYPVGNSAGAIQTEFRLLANASNPLAHSPMIVLFGPGGTELDRKPFTRDTREFEQQWGQQMGMQR